MRGGLKGGPGRILGVQVGEELIDIIEELNKEIVHNNNNRNLNTTHIMVKIKNQITQTTNPYKQKDSKSHHHYPKTTPKTNKKLTILFQIVSKIQ